MRKSILIFIGIISLNACNRKCKVPLRYKNGDIVYLKPDSNKAVITKASECYTYRISYKLPNGDYTETTVFDYQIF
jgi:hypothetical protein